MSRRTKLKPELKTGEKANLNRHWRGLFLDTLAETSNVSEASRKAGANPSRAYKVRRSEQDFREAWKAALLEGYEHLELETLYRLRHGTGKDDNKFDVANALRLLTLHRETVAHERAKHAHVDEESVLESLNAKIDAMRKREADVKQMLLEDGTAKPDGDGDH